MPDIIKDHFKSFGLSADHVRSLFNPKDQQDVKLAFDLLKDVWSLPRESTNCNPGVAIAQRLCGSSEKPSITLSSPISVLTFLFLSRLNI